MRKILMVAVCMAVCALSALAQGPGEGSFPMTIINKSKVYADSQIYIYALGMTGGKWCHLDSLGNPVPMNAADKNAVGHLTKNGQNYPNYNVRLSSAKNMRIPQAVGGGRIYIAVGSPMYITGDAGGVQLPDPNNPSEANNDVYYDWFEYCYEYNKLQFGGNTTQVDIFGFPMTVRIKQAASKYDDSCGIAAPRASIVKYFRDQMSAPFQESIKSHRVVAPRSASQFGKGGAYENYMKPMIDSLWDLWSTSQLVFYNGTQKYMGNANAATGVLTFSGQESATMTKPTTQEVWSNTGTRFPGYVGAAFSAALCRGVARNGAWWYDKATYYKKSAFKNDFSDVLHRISIHNLAYGFGYDDNNNQSSVLIVGSSKPLDLFEIRIESMDPADSNFVFPGVSVDVQKTFTKHNTAMSNRVAIQYEANNQLFLQSALPITKASIISANGRSIRRMTVGNNIVGTKGIARGNYLLQVVDVKGNASILKVVRK